MDLEKIGLFIKECRKVKNLTQEELAEKLNISFKTVSRWECGLGLPDVATMIPLCEILDISLTELLNGSHIDSKDYMEKSEEKLLEMARKNEESNKRLLFAENLIAISLIIIIVSAVLVASFVAMPNVWRIVMIVAAFLVVLPLITFCILIEQKAGYYRCEKCNHIYEPGFKQVFFAMHIGRTRYMKCPCCHKYSWQKKVLKK